MKGLSNENVTYYCCSQNIDKICNYMHKFSPKTLFANLTAPLSVMLKTNRCPPGNKQRQEKSSEKLINFCTLFSFNNENSKYIFESIRFCVFNLKVNYANMRSRNCFSIQINININKHI